MPIERFAGDTQAERLILGALILNGERFAEVGGQLAVADFVMDVHQRVFTAMRNLESAQRPIDTVNLATMLRGSEGLMPGGVLAFLLELQTGIPENAHLDSYVRTIRDQSTLRKIRYAAQVLIQRSSEANAEPAEILEAARKEFLQLAELTQETTLSAPSEIIEAAGGLTAYIDRRDHRAGLATGYKQLDVLTGGLRPGALYIIGARPRMGKTALALNIAENVSVQHEDTSLVFSLEMSRESLIDRLICSRARVNSKRFEGGFLNREEAQRAARAAGEIAAYDRIRIDDRAVTTTAEIHAKIRRHAARNPVGLVIVDYLQLLIGGDSRYRVAEASRISRDLKLIAKDCKAPVIALSQLNRDCDTRENHEPTLADLRETGAIEQDADLVGFLYRPEVYSPDCEHLRGLAELIVAKQRNGPEGRIGLVWIGEYTRFEEKCYE